MGSAEIVFDQPFGKPSVELCCVRQHVSHAEKLFLKRAIEPLVDRVVFGGLDS